MGIKKSKPKTVPRLHEIKIDAIVERTQKSVESSKNRITKSKMVKDATKQLIENRRKKFPTKKH